MADALMTSTDLDVVAKIRQDLINKELKDGGQLPDVTKLERLSVCRSPASPCRNWRPSFPSKRRARTGDNEGDQGQLPRTCDRRDAASLDAERVELATALGPQRRHGLGQLPESEQDNLNQCAKASSGSPWPSTPCFVMPPPHFRDCPWCCRR